MTDPVVTPEIFDEVIQRLSKGEPFAQIVRSEGMPSMSSIRRYAEANDAERFVRARSDGFDQIAFDALNIANTPCMGIRKKHSLFDTEEFEEDMLGHRKLQVETRLRLLAKWDPKRYGDLMRTEISGPDGGPVRMSDDARIEKLHRYLALQRKANDAVSDLFES